MCLIIGTPKNINFPFETNGKLMILGVPVLKHFKVTLYVAFGTRPYRVCSNDDVDLDMIFLLVLQFKLTVYVQLHV